MAGSDFDLPSADGLSCLDITNFLSEFLTILVKNTSQTKNQAS